MLRDHQRITNWLRITLSPDGVMNGVAVPHDITVSGYELLEQQERATAALAWAAFADFGECDEERGV